MKTAIIVKSHNIYGHTPARGITVNFIASELVPVYSVYTYISSYLLLANATNLIT